MKYYDYLDNENENLIIKELASDNGESLNGIMAIEIDNYNVINEMFGKNQMDIINKTVCNVVNTTFFGTDIVVQTRGDEFIILTKNIREINNLEFIASKLISSIAKICVMDSFYLTSSIGIAIYPFHGKSYSELKDRAYQARARAKANGKNVFRIYDSARTKALYHDYVFNRNLFDKINASDQFFSFDIDNNFKDICLHMFQEDRDSLSALNSVLELTCLYLGFNRAYMIGSQTINAAQKNKLRYADAGYEFGTMSATRSALLNDMHARIRENYKRLSLINTDDEGIDEELRLTLEDECVSQILYFPVYRGDTYIAALVFQNMSDNIIEMSQDELDELEEQMASITTYFLNVHNKYFSKENLSKLDMFESMDANVYIIDTETNVIEFANDKALSACTTSCVGQLCYQCLASRSTECVDCPAKTMDPNDPKAHAAGDIYNYSCRQWNRAIYSWLDTHDNKNKAIVIGVDVSDYVDIR